MTDPDRFYIRKDFQEEYGRRMLSALRLASFAHESYANYVLNGVSTDYLAIAAAKIPKWEYGADVFVDKDIEIAAANKEGNWSVKGILRFVDYAEGELCVESSTDGTSITVPFIGDGPRKFSENDGYEMYMLSIPRGANVGWLFEHMEDHITF